jgi:hypothetical protein
VGESRELNELQPAKFRCIAARNLQVRRRFVTKDAQPDKFGAVEAPRALQGAAKGRPGFFWASLKTLQRAKSSGRPAKLSSRKKLKFSGPATLSVSPGDKYQKHRGTLCTSHRLRR